MRYQYAKLREGVIRLCSNENPLGCSRSVLRAIRDCSDISTYPEPTALELRRSLSKHLKVPMDWIFVGSGVDGIIDSLVKLFGKKVVIPIPTFPYYEISTTAVGGKPKFVLRDSNFDINVRSMIKAVRGATLSFICSPNNPTGNQMGEDELRDVLDNSSCMIALDEAYVEFSDFSLLNLVRDYENLVVMRTFSKAFGLAGLRIGYAVAHENIVREIARVSPPFPVSTVAIRAAIAALHDREHLMKTVKIVREGRKFLMREIPFKTYPSSANFVLVDVSPMTSAEVCEYMLDRGIAIRDCSSIRGLGSSFVRISVGTPEQNELVVRELRRLYESGI